MQMLMANETPYMPPGFAPPKEQAGFTLIELLITLAIMGILTLVAYPSYQDSVRKTRRADAIAGALTLQVAQEKFRASCPFYAQSLGSANTCGTTAALSTVQGSTASTDGFYTLAILAASATGNSYTIVADPTGLQASDTGCDPMTITFNTSNPNGLKAPADCW